MSQTHNPMPVLPCFCASLRRASRAVTQHYDAALRRHGLRATQFNILQVLARAGEISQGRLGGILSMDSTTLTRTLEIMARRGWIAQRAGADRRQRHLSLSAMGRRRMRRATPAWEKAQSQLRGAVGEKLWGDFQKRSDQVTLAVTKGD
jgi:DNA-binding MarR family transcriptional regulator